MEPRVNQRLLWSDELLVGNPKIDAEHKEIFELLKQLWSNAPLSKMATIELLLSHLTDHFEGEESTPQFQALSRSEAEQHKSEHRTLKEFVLQTKSLIHVEEDAFYSTVIDFIQDKLIPHIRNHDKLLANE